MGNKDFSKKLTIMTSMHFSDRLAKIIKEKNTCLMLGLDPNWDKLPKHLKTSETLQDKADIYEKFCTDMVDTCAEYVCGIKIQMGYFEALGSVGVKAVENIITFTRKNHGDLIIMIDAKRGDIGSTSKAYSQAFLGAESPLAGDCVTVAPYMGTNSITPFIGTALRNGRGVFILAKTSNPSSSQIQDLTLPSGDSVAMLWAKIFEGMDKDIAEDLAKPDGTGVTEEGSNIFLKSKDTKYSCIGAVVGATHPEELGEFHKIFKSTWILAPGVGAQGGKIEDVLSIRDEDGLGILIPVSRGILYASTNEDYLDAAKAEAQKLWEAQKR